MYVYENPAISSLEFYTSRAFAFSDEADAVCVFAFEIEFHKCVIHSFFGGIATACNFHGAGIIGVEAELDDVEYVCAAVSHFATAVCMIESPPEMAPSAYVGHLWCVSEPHIIIETLWNRRDGLGLEARAEGIVVRLIGGHTDVDGVDLAYSAVANQFAGKTRGVVGAFVAASLEYSAVAFDSIADGAAFGDAVGERFFAVDVLARLCSGYGDKGVPVVGGADGDGVDVIAGEQVPEVTVCVESYERFGSSFSCAIDCVLETSRGTTFELI